MAPVFKGTLPESTRDDVGSLRPQISRDRNHLHRIVEFLEAGAVSAPLITSFKLSQTETAHRLSESRHLRGNLVFAVEGKEDG